MFGVNRSSELQERLNRMAQMLPTEASAGTEARLLLVFRAQRRRRRIWRYVGSAAACAALSLGLFLVQRLEKVRQTKSVDDSYAAATAGFVALPYAESGVPMEDAVIVRLRLRTSELGRLGVPAGPGTANGQVADLLVGQDGVARAVRLVE
jgi:hypothetical protein